MGASLQVQLVVKAKANTPVAVSVEYQGADGTGENVGTGDQTTNARGQTVFDLEQEILRAVASSKGPGTLKVKVRHGGTDFDAPPINDTFVEEISIL